MGDWIIVSGDQPFQCYPFSLDSSTVLPPVTTVLVAPPLRSIDETLSAVLSGCSVPESVAAPVIGASSSILPELSGMLSSGLTLGMEPDGSEAGAPRQKTKEVTKMNASRVVKGVYFFCSRNFEF